MPEIQLLYDEHLRTYDELLPHVLFGELTEFVLSAEREGRTELVERTLRALERLLVEGDEMTVNLVAVSFVEYFDYPEDEHEAAVATRFPGNLAEELLRQRNRRPGRPHKCRECGGTGRVPGIRKVLGMGKGMGSEFGPCPGCDGVGWLAAEPNE